MLLRSAVRGGRAVSAASRCQASTRRGGPRAAFEMPGLAGTGDAPRARPASPLSVSPLPGLAPGPWEGWFRAEPGSELVDSFDRIC